MLFGIALAGLGQANRPLVSLLEQISTVLMRMIGGIIKLAPLAVLSGWAIAGP